MILFEGHEDVYVGRANETGCAVNEIDGAVRQTDVVENVVQFLRRNNTADRVFDEIGKARGFFNTRTDLNTHIKDKLPTIGIGKKVFTQPGHEGPGTKTQQKKHEDKYEPPMNQGHKQALVAVAQTLKAALERI